MNRYLWLFAAPFIIQASTQTVPDVHDIRIDLRANACVNDVCCYRNEKGLGIMYWDGKKIVDAKDICFRIPEGKWNGK